MELTGGIVNPEEKSIKERSQKMLLWVAMVSMVMVFASLASAYILRSSEGQWDLFALPRVFYYSTAVLILSSLSLNFAVRSAEKDNHLLTAILTTTTLVLGITFAILQFKGWGDLVEMGVYFTGTKSASGTFLYFLTGLHLAHLAFGMISLLVVTIRSAAGKYGPGNTHGLRLAATFWHFLDFLWIFLFLFLLFIR